MCKRFFILFLILVGFTPYSQGISFEETKVLVHLNRYDLHDTAGFNLVEQLSKLFYEEIITGRLTLWDSPEKKVRINPQALQIMEQEYGKRFVHSEDLFLNENWTLFRRRLRFEIMGFAFLSKKANGERLNFGFIAMQDAKSLLKDHLLLTNANGPAEITCYNGLYARNYPFNVVQFGNDDFKDNPLDAVRIRLELYHNPKIRVRSKYCIKQEKRITASMYAGSQKPENVAFFKALDSYLMQNREFFFNHGGENIISFYDTKTAIKVTRAEILSHWEKAEDGKLVRQIEWLMLYVNGKPMQLITEDELKQMDCVVMLSPLLDFLRNFEYEFQLNTINQQEIPSIESPMYVKALYQAPWKQLSNFENQNTQ